MNNRPPNRTKRLIVWHFASFIAHLYERSMRGKSQVSLLGAFFLWSLRVLPLSVWVFFIEFWCPPSVRCIPISLKLPVTRVTFRCITTSLTTGCRTWIRIKDSSKQMSDVNKSFMSLRTTQISGTKSEKILCRATAADGLLNFQAVFEGHTVVKRAL